MHDYNRYTYSFAKIWLQLLHRCTNANLTIFLAFNWWMAMNESFNVIDFFIFQLLLEVFHFASSAYTLHPHWPRLLSLPLCIFDAIAYGTPFVSIIFYSSSHHLIWLRKKIKLVPFILRQPYLKAECIQLDPQLIVKRMRFTSRPTAHICESSSLH